MAGREESVTMHEQRLARNYLNKWREEKKRRAAKCAENHKFANVGESLLVMQKGSEFIKVRASNKRYPRTYSLSKDAKIICWSPSKKGDRAKIPVSAIKEVREGAATDALSQTSLQYSTENCFSIIYGDGFKSVDLVAQTKEECMHWVVGVRYLLVNQGEDEIQRRQRARDEWLKETFLAADKSGDGLLSVEEVCLLLHKLNVKISNKKVKEAFKAADTDTEDSEGLLDFKEFISFYKSISTRRELYLLLLKYGNSKEFMTADELGKFLESEQRLEGITPGHCDKIIATYEPIEENRLHGVLGIDGFTNFLLGPDGDILNPEHQKVNQDMSRPLSHYFIASSHNTYLLGDQLTSSSSMDMYVRVLQSGCRCIELDCWDGKDGEPVIYHGYTLTSKVKFRYVILNINDFAFIYNKYPVILSLENHCSAPQQKFMAKFMKSVFKVVYAEKYDGKELPSPQSLVGKILIKTKKLSLSISDDLEEGEVTEEDSADELEDCFKFKENESSEEHKRKEKNCRRLLTSIRRLRMTKDDDESDARGDLSSAIVSSVALVGTGTNNKPTLKRSFSTREHTPRKTPAISKSISEDQPTKTKLFRRKKRKNTLNENDFKRTIKLNRHLSDLVAYTRSSSFRGLELHKDEYYWEVITIPEAKVYRYVETKGEQFVRYTSSKLCRIYPAGYRIDSSNPNPQTFWNCGCQLVALNYQTDGRMMQTNRGRFRSNGNCGYVLKPNIMCTGEAKFDPMTRKDVPQTPRKLLQVKVISGQQLPKPKDSILGDRGEIIDPYVEVEVIGIPADNMKYRTKTVEDNEAIDLLAIFTRFARSTNRFNPVWEETMKFVIKFPELALLRFAVWDEDPIGRDFIGQFTIPYTSIVPGYRHVHLEGLDQASIFIHVITSDYHGEKLFNADENVVRERRMSVGVKVKRKLRRQNST